MSEDCVQKLSTPSCFYLEKTIKQRCSLRQKKGLLPNVNRLEMKKRRKTDGLRQSSKTAN